MVNLILLVFALVCFILASTSPGAPHWNRLVSAGLAFLTAAMLWGSAAFRAAS